MSALRNFGIIAHVDAGKTTLSERVLLHAGRIRKVGEVHDGNTVMDFDPIERKRGITIQAAATTVFWEPLSGVRGRRHRLNLIDTPGHIDFAIEVERSLRVLDGAVVVLDGSQGVEPQTEAVWRQADHHRVPRVVFVNKLDKVGASFAASVESLRERLGACPVAVQLPIGLEGEHRGVIDLLRRKALLFDAPSRGVIFQSVDVPVERLAEVEAARLLLVEACAEFDEGILTSFVEGRAAEVTAEELEAALRRGTLGLRLVPVLCGSAYQGSGIQPLLDAVVAYLPEPPEGAELLPLSALIFKVVTEPHLGTLAYVRVYSGVLRSGEKVLNANTGRNERVGRLVLMHAGTHEDISEAPAGIIAAVIGLREARTGQTVCHAEAPVQLESLRFPDPVVELALEPRSRSDADRLSAGLSKLMLADPSLVVTSHLETGQALLRGMGELHLEVAIQRLREEHQVEVQTGQPQVAYRETLQRVARVDYRHVRQSGGPGQFARVVLEVRPLPRGGGIVFRDGTRGGVIPAEYVPAVERGVRGAMERGIGGGYPLTDVEVELVDGAIHSHDSNAQAFEIAGSLALQEAAKSAGRTVLEPIMALQVTTPESFVGAVLGDLGARHGRVQQLEARAKLQVIDAQAPLRKLFGYVSALRSRTEGRASATMRLSHYDVRLDT